MEKEILTQGKVSSLAMLGLVIVGIIGYLYGNGKIQNFDIKNIYENILHKDSSNSQDIASSLEKLAIVCQQAGYIDTTKCQFAIAKTGQSVKDILLKNGFDKKEKNFELYEKFFIKLNGLQGISPSGGKVYILPAKNPNLNVDNIQYMDFSLAYETFAKKCSTMTKCLISTPANQSGSAQGLDDFLKSNGGWSANVRPQSIHSIFLTMNNMTAPELELGKYYMFATTNSINGENDKNAPSSKSEKQASEQNLQSTQPQFVSIKASSDDTFYSLFRKAGYSDIKQYNKFINSENKNFDPKNNIWIWNGISEYDQNSKPQVGKEYKILNLKAGQEFETFNEKNLRKKYLQSIDFIRQNKLDIYPLISFELFKKLVIRESSGMHLKNGKVALTENRVGTRSVGLTQMTPAALEDVNQNFGTNFSLEDIKYSEQKNIISSILYYSILSKAIPQVGDENYKTCLMLSSYNGGAATTNAIYQQAKKPKSWDEMRSWMLKQMYGEDQNYVLDKDSNGIEYRNFFTKNFDKNKQVIKFTTSNGVRSWKADKFQEIIKYVEIINFPQTQTSIKTN